VGGDSTPRRRLLLGSGIREVERGCPPRPTFSENNMISDARKRGDIFQARRMAIGDAISLRRYRCTRRRRKYRKSTHDSDGEETPDKSVAV